MLIVGVLIIILSASILMLVEELAMKIIFIMAVYLIIQ